MIQRGDQAFLDYSMTVRQDKTFGTFKLTTKAPPVTPHVCKKCPFREEALAEYEKAVELEKQRQAVELEKQLQTIKKKK